MDPFTQRMLDRARARQEKIDQKLASSGQVVPKRKPFAENTIGATKTSETSSVKSPIKSLKSQSPIKSPSRRSSVRNDQKLVSTPQRRDVIVTKKEFNSPKRSNSSRKSDVSVEINIMHREDIQIEVQVEERDSPLTVYDAPSENNVMIKEIEDNTSSEILDKKQNNMDSDEPKSALRKNVKSRLDRLGVLYSDKADLSSPIQRTEKDFTSATPPSAYKIKETKTETKTEPKKGSKKFGRLAALADEINNWEDDLSHHDFHPEPVKKTNKLATKKNEESTLDVSIHSYQDINKAITKISGSPNKTTAKPVNSRTFVRQSPSKSQKLDNNIVAELEGEGYRRVSASQSRLVYDFSSSKNAVPDRQEPKGASSSPRRASVTKMATMVAVKPTVAKKPSIKKYKAPTPPRKAEDESEKDKENNVVEREENDNIAATVDCVQTKPEPAQEGTEQVIIGKGSPVVRRLAPKLNGHADRNSVLSKAAMFEAGSPKSKDPAEMSLRERKALFEKNKGAAIVPKAPFGLAPSVKTLHGDNKDLKPVKPLTSATNIRTTPTKNIPNSNSKEDTTDNISQTSVGGGIRGKLAALFNRENSETNLGARYRQERDKEMEMLQSRYQYNKNITLPKQRPAQSDDEADPSEHAPLMGSTLSLGQVHKKPEIIGNIPKVTFEDLKTKSETALHHRDGIKDDEGNVVGTQPVKRRSSQDSPVVLSVLEDVKRIKVNTSKNPPTNGTVVQQPTSIYPHLSDIETDNSHTADENSDCGSSDTKDEPEKLNRSDNWADTSFGREVMKVVKKNSSYTKAINNVEGDSSSNIDSDLDDLLDEALNEEDSEGPTPPKVHKKRNSLSSRSFTYKEGSPVKKQFKSPLKVAVTPAKTPGDKGNELVHSVSFYRRTQNASSQPTTPIRIIRHISPDRDASTTDQGATSVTTVRERIKQLQEEIVKQQTIISQASQALNLCAATVEFSGSTEQAEGERLLLLATHRRQACVHEVQRLQVEGAGEAARAGAASLKLHDIRLPLRRDYIRQLNADGAVGHHAVCILKCRDRVVATSMQQTKGDSVALFFPDLVHMEGLNSDFKVTIEVYLLQASKEFLPHDVKYHISNKKSSKLLTPRSRELKAPRIQSPAGPTSVRTPQFQPHGYCIFALPQANRDNFTLSKLPAASPLEGSLQVKIVASIQAPIPKPHSAFLTAFDDVRGLGAWHRRWFLLQTPRLSYWKYPDDVQKKLPIGDIDLSTVVSDRAIKAPRDLCARPNTLLLETSVPMGLIPESGSLVYHRRQDGTVVRRHLLAADTAADRDVWIDRLNKALEYVKCCPAED